MVLTLMKPLLYTLAKTNLKLHLLPLLRKIPIIRRYPITTYIIISML